MLNKLIKMIKNEDKKLSKSLAKRILEIRQQNKENLINERIIPYFRKQGLEKTGLLLTDKELKPIAEFHLNMAVANGFVDNLFNVIGEEITSEI